ncbi:MAG TPA: hypothetical protein VLL95_10175, partial [Phnomibacter sp.]|nr:hypothetical protein [Phnomibacter sp.]
MINSKPYEHLANPRTFLTLLISAFSCFIVLFYDLKLNNETMLFGLIISFPLVFSLQSSFRRRDRALEFLSLFKASLNVVYRSIARSKKMPEEKRLEARQLLNNAADKLVLCLRDSTVTPRQVYDAFDEVFYFVESQGKMVAGNGATRVIRYMRDVYESGAFLLSLKSHRTIVALRMFSFIFINLFPFMQAAVLNQTMGHEVPQYVIYAASLVTAFVLITMYNIQVQLEYPFDQIGLDDI